MKKLVLAALLSIGMIGFAQNQQDKQKLTVEQRNEKNLQKLTSELNLDSKQQKQVGDLLASRSAEMQQWKMTNKDRQTKPSTEERDAMKQQMKERKLSNNNKMKAILTSEQYTKYTANQEKRLQKMNDRKNKNHTNKEHHEDHNE